MTNKKNITPTDEWVWEQKQQDHSDEYRQEVERYSEILAKEERHLEYAREKVATATGKSLGYWKVELRRAEGAVPRYRQKLAKYKSLLMDESIANKLWPLPIT